MHKFWAKPSLKLLLWMTLLVIICRAVLTAIGFVAIKIERGDAATTFWPLFSSIFSKAGDSSYYLYLAEHGYTATGEYAKSIVFYPLYPLLIRLTEMVVGDYFIAGLLASLLCLILASWYIYRLLQNEYDDITALRGVLLLQIYPFSVFLGGVYTESLFILLTSMVFYYLQQRAWKTVALVAFLGGLNRTQGIVLLLPILYEYCLAQQLFQSCSFRWQRLTKEAFAIACIPMGYGCYLLMNKIVQGDWFAFVEHLKAPPWYQGAAWVGDNIAQHFAMSEDHYPLGFYIYWPQILGFLGSMALLGWAIRNGVRTSWIIYGLASLTLSFTASWLISGARYLLGNLSIFLLLSVYVQNELKRLLVYSVFSFLLVFYTIAFWQGQSIM